jgi:CheY-like chemotaxis protein
LQTSARVPKRILVVDDLSYMRDIQVLLLKEAGYTATALATAREALDRLPELSPDLILLDLSMPGMDGRQFLHRLRALPQWKALPVILTTGRTADEVKGLGDCEVLSKPFSDAALIDRVRRLIGDANEHSRAS